MPEGENLLPLAILVYAALLATVVAIVALIRSGRVPDFDTTRRHKG